MASGTTAFVQGAPGVCECYCETYRLTARPMPVGHCVPHLIGPGGAPASILRARARAVRVERAARPIQSIVFVGHAGALQIIEPIDREGLQRQQTASIPLPLRNDFLSRRRACRYRAIVAPQTVDVGPHRSHPGSGGAWLLKQDMLATGGTQANIAPTRQPADRPFLSSDTTEGIVACNQALSGRVHFGSLKPACLVPGPRHPVPAGTLKAQGEETSRLRKKLLSRGSEGG